MPVRIPCYLAVCALAITLASPILHASSSEGWSGELRLRSDDSRPGRLTLAPEPASSRIELELRGQWQLDKTGLRTRLQWQALTMPGGIHQSGVRVDELSLAGDHGAWQTSVGRQVVSWDVGHAFRPNDLVQQEVRRSLLLPPLRGRPLMQIEHFGAESSTALVWVNPQNLNSSSDTTLGPEESALAARWYGRMAGGAADVHTFARWGRRTRMSLGAATSWVASDALSVHASLRMLQRRDGWVDAAGSSHAIFKSNPWRLDTLGSSAQALVGASWTGQSQQSVLLEWWRDGTALSDGQWASWRQRKQALTAMVSEPGLTTAALAGNQAWQASPLAGIAGIPSLRRDNLFLRLGWQPGAWTAALDVWYTPADKGRALTASVQWQGDRLRLQGALRQFSGPADSVLRQLPSRLSAAVMASWSF